MKIKNQVFLSFTTKEEYFGAVNVWKWNMREVVSLIRQNNYELYSHQINIPRRQQMDDHSYFIIENLNTLRFSQNKKIALAKMATEMLKTRKKMKKIAGKQMEERQQSSTEKELSVV